MGELSNALKRCSNGAAAAELLSDLEQKERDFRHQLGYTAAAFVEGDIAEVRGIFDACRACDNAGYAVPVGVAGASNTSDTGHPGCLMSEPDLKTLHNLADYYSNPQTQIPGASEIPVLANAAARLDFTS